jgi:lipid-binding SYLF domain-containing protein
MKRFLPFLLLMLVFAVPARAETPEEVVVKASATVQNILGDPNFGLARQRLKGARAVLIVPQLIKAGFIVGGEGGYGVLLVRGQGGWSAPTFYILAAASLGLQIGVEAKEVIFIINTERGLNALLANQMKLGADASIAVGPVGAGVEASSAGTPNADIIAFSKSQGLFGGAALEGAMISSKEDMNRDFYGRALTTRQILADPGLHNPAADGLRRALAAY